MATNKNKIIENNSLNQFQRRKHINVKSEDKNRYFSQKKKFMHMKNQKERKENVATSHSRHIFYLPLLWHSLNSLSIRKLFCSIFVRCVTQRECESIWVFVIKNLVKNVTMKSSNELFKNIFANSFHFRKFCGFTSCHVIWLFFL